MGAEDSMIRLFLAIVIAHLIYKDIFTGTTGDVMMTVAGVFVFTSLVSFCPFYTPFGFKTRRPRKE